MGFLLNINPFNHPFIHPVVHSFAHSFIRSFVLSLIQVSVNPNFFMFLNCPEMNKTGKLALLLENHEKEEEEEKAHRVTLLR